MASDPIITGFDAAAVRAGLRVAFAVGMPVSTDDQPKFYLPQPLGTNDGSPTDQEGIAFNPIASKRRTAPAVPPVQVKCAVEYHDGQGKIENFGIIVPSKIVITLLDEDYAKVKGFEYVVIAGQRYFYQSTEAAKGLVTVGIWKVHCYSEDEG